MGRDTKQEGKSRNKYTKSESRFSMTRLRTSVVAKNPHRGNGEEPTLINKVEKKARAGTHQGWWELAGAGWGGGKQMALGRKKGGKETVTEILSEVQKGEGQGPIEWRGGDKTIYSLVNTIRRNARKREGSMSAVELGEGQREKNERKASADKH